MKKFIFLTGGVVSSVGKGVTAAAMGRVLKARGLRVAIQKLDPYLNVDPGTMSPYQHGEVFVTEDGAETDLDLGHYERFTDENLTRASNFTTGQVYNEVLQKERRGDYLGKTIQVIPHVTSEIKRRIALVAKTNADVIICEVGGTVGDIEAMPFLEAIRQMRRDVGRENTMYVHVTFLPMIGATGEQKTKPSQHSVRDLRGAGIQPDAIIARSDLPVDDDVRNKLALFCDVEPRAVIPMPTVKSLYEVPVLLEQLGFGDLICERMGIAHSCTADLSAWKTMMLAVQRPKPEIKIAIVGKYADLPDAYFSVRESLYHAGVACDRDVKIDWINSEQLERDKNGELMARVKAAQGIVVPGGFGERGIEGKVKTAHYAREHKVPYLGLCLGMQIMCIEFARHVLHTDEVNSTEFDPATAHPIIDLMPDQRDISDMGGTMRLGAYPCKLTPNTKAYHAYAAAEAESAEAVAKGQAFTIHERHRHRYEFNNQYRKQLSDAGMIFSGVSPDNHLIEISEFRDHPFMLGSQFHPEFKSRPNRPHPLFKAFIEACIARTA
ncbi:MAG: CTP synthase [Chloroflexota bacterium]